MNPLDPNMKEQEKLWERLVTHALTYPSQIKDYPVLPRVTQADLLSELSEFDFKSRKPASDVLDFVIEHMERSQMHTANPAYFGVFNPVASPIAVLGETLTSLHNAQLASWTSSPFLIEIEQHLLKSFGERFGYSQTEGTFTSGGTEANLMALTVSLHKKFPSMKREGLFGIKQKPGIYVSQEGHHSIERASHISGVGLNSVRRIRIDSDLKLDVNALKEAIFKDRKANVEPTLLVATCGTTNGGIFDDIAPLVELAKNEGLWLHLDAAWGGAAVLLPEFSELFSGTEKADSISLDAHKWLSVPMTAGMFLTRHEGALKETYRLDRSDYMPEETTRGEKHQPYQMSPSWSRKSYGLKLFMALASVGWDGYVQTLRHQVEMGAYLKERLSANGYDILNKTELPVVCFTEPSLASHEAVESFAEKVAATGKSWVTTTTLADGKATLRAGISNYRTQRSDIDELVTLLNKVRTQLVGERS